MGDPEKKQGGVMVPSLGGLAGSALEQGKGAMLTHGDSAEVFLLMNQRDEDQIMRELMGHFSKEYVYDIPFNNSDGTTTHAKGLSWAGIKEARRLYGGIDVDIIEGPDLHGDPSDANSFYTCKARAKDLKSGNATTAAYRQKLWGKRKGGGVYQIEFAYEFAQSKAKRNAIAELLPQPLVKAWIDDFSKGRESFDPRRVLELKEGEDFKVNDSSKSLPDAGGAKQGERKSSGGSKKAPPSKPQAPPTSGGAENGGSGRRSGPGGPPMTAPQFGMIHKLIKESGLPMPPFMFDPEGNLWKDFASMPDQFKVSVGEASDAISKLLAGQAPWASGSGPVNAEAGGGAAQGQGSEGGATPGDDDFALS